MKPKIRLIWSLLLPICAPSCMHQPAIPTHAHTTMQVNVHVTGFAEKPGLYTVPYLCSDHELEKVCGGWGPLGDSARIHVIRFARAEGEQRFESSQKDEILRKNQLRKVGDQYVFEPNDVIYIPMRQELGPR